ncbi:MAG: hypothetical protein Q9216_001395 [Gyalolechia sp. 2 TL-2023]
MGRQRGEPWSNDDQLRPSSSYAASPLAIHTSIKSLDKVLVNSCIAAVLGNGCETSAASLSTFEMATCGKNTSPRTACALPYLLLEVAPSSATRTAYSRNRSESATGFDIGNHDDSSATFRYFRPPPQY